MDSRYTEIAEMIKNIEEKLNIKIEGFDKCKDYENLSDWIINLGFKDFTGSKAECNIINEFKHTCAEKYNIIFMTGRIN